MTGAEYPASDLRDLRGPSALGGTPLRFRRLLWRMTRTDLAVRYHNSVLGYLWTLLEPLLLFAVLYLAFTRVLRFGGGIPHYPALLLFNIMLISLFTQTSSRATTSLVGRGAIMRKAQLPRLLIPMSILAASLITFSFSLAIVIGFMLVSGVPVLWTWLLVPLPILGVAGFTAGCALLLSAVYVRYRDVASIWTAISRAVFYASPALYPIEFFPESWHFVLWLNPLAPLLVEARVWLFDAGAPTYAEALGGSIYYVPPALVGLGICALGAWYFFRRAPGFAEEL